MAVDAAAAGGGDPMASMRQAFSSASAMQAEMTALSTAHKSEMTVYEMIIKAYNQLKTQ